MAAIDMIGDKYGADLISFFNNQPLHSPPVALGLANVAIARATTRKSSLNISTINHRLPRTDTEKVMIFTIITVNVN